MMAANSKMSKGKTKLVYFISYVYKLMSRFESQRKVLKEACEKKEKNYPPSLAAVVKSAVIWKEVLKFIKETGLVQLFQTPLLYSA